MLPIADDMLERLLAEDAPHGDLTTRMLGIGDRPGRIAFIARTDMVVCCVEEAARMFRLRGAGAQPACRSGDRVTAGTLLLQAAGPAEALHLVWKTAQTLVDHTAGIATAARRIVEAARRTNPAVMVACTRKNFPGTKAFAIKAIIAGGATPHRLGLSETILVFPEHRAFFDDTVPVAEHLRRLKAGCPERKLIAEVTSIKEAGELAGAGVDVLQLEKFTPDETRSVVDMIRTAGLPTLVAAAGGVNADNAEAYALSGADILVSSAPYAARPADIKVILGPA